MKNLRLILFASTALFGMVACNEKDDLSLNKSVESVKPITFEVTTNITSPGVNSKAYTPVYTADNLKIQAYKLNEGNGNYVYSHSFTLPNASYIPLTKTWKGDVTLETGTYKFIPSYGLGISDNISLSLLEGQALNSNINFTFLPSTASFPEIFLPLRNVEEIKSYEVGEFNRLNETVRDSISRAVSRVDVIFIKARKVGDQYIEESYGNGLDIFGQLGLGKLEFRFTGIANSMNVLGQAQTGITNARIIAPYTLEGGVTIGTNPSETVIGNEDYFRFDSIQTNDIIKGSAHVFGTYLLPDNGEPTAQLQLYAEPLQKTGRWTARTINIIPINYDAIPFEQNKVTLIKVYVLRDHLFGVDPDDPDPIDPDPEDPTPPTPPGPDPDFAVEIEVLVLDDWDESNHVDHSIE